ncbi:MAG: uroporphyrinogen-III C-methyltransferase [Rhodospirillaceae bacterium]|nr:uroporphyrinogen-III C-methyltransferase [Rhodospirillaceae bacterium]
MFHSSNGIHSSPAAASAALPPVHLVGAGAGDAGHLTLAARDVLARADVVFVDDLVDRTVLDLIPRRVEIHYVGKRAGQPSAQQADIQAQLIAAAQSGRRVARLKGGDPFIFGRGGEEADALRAAGLEVAVLPGLTAALVAAAATGIALTDRRHATQVTFITATESDGATPGLAGLAGKGRTLVIYMGGAQGAEIARQLLSNPVTARLPIAVVQDAGRTTQDTIFTTAETLARDLARRDLAKPTLIIVGDVVTPALRRQAQPFQEVHFAHG